MTFDDIGALVKISTEMKDATLQRASDLSALLSSVGTSVSAGKSLRDALAPPSLVDRAAEAKAAAELGLTPSKPDPLKEQLAEEQLKAQLKIAQQLQTATSPPVFVTVTQALD